MRVFLLILSVFLSSCQKGDDQSAQSDAPVRPDAIVGTWKSEPKAEERRERFIEMTFTEDGRVTGYSVKFIDSKSGEISGTIPIEGTYRIREGIIHWMMEGSRAEVPYRMEDGMMHLTLGKEKHLFRRQAAPLEDGDASSTTF